MVQNTGGFKDFLQEQMDLKKPCTIKFRTVEGGIALLKARIISIEQEDEKILIITDNGLSIGLEQLMEVNGRQPENYC